MKTWGPVVGIVLLSIVGYVAFHFHQLRLMMAWEKLRSEDLFQERTCSRTQESIEVALRSWLSTHTPGAALPKVEDLGLPENRRGCWAIGVDLPAHTISAAPGRTPPYVIACKRHGDRAALAVAIPATFARIHAIENRWGFPLSREQIGWKNEPTAPKR